MPTPNGGSPLSVAAVSGRDVWAVGGTGSPIGSVGLVEHWDGTAWAVVPSPDVGLGSAHITELSGVAVASPTSVWAVGYHSGGSNRQRTLVEHWDGSAWTVVPTPNANGLDNRLTGVVTVPSTGGVWAFGVHATRTGGSRQLILHRGRYGWAVARRQPLVPASRLDAGAVVPGALPRGRTRRRNGFARGVLARREHGVDGRDGVRSRKRGELALGDDHAGPTAIGGQRLASGSGDRITHRGRFAAHREVPAHHPFCSH